MPLEPAPSSRAGASRLANASEREPVNGGELAGMTPPLDGSIIGPMEGRLPRAPGRGQGGAGSGASEQPEDFVWPGRGRAAGRGGERASTEGAGPDPGSPAVPGSGGQGAGAGSLLAPGAGGTSDKAAGQLAGGFLAAAAGGPEPDSQPGVPDQSIMVGAGNAEDVGTGQSSGAMAGAFTAGAGGVDPVGSASGSTLGTANSEDVGGGKRAGGFVAAAGGGLNARVQPGGPGSRMTGKSGNAEDTKAGAGADPADQPYAGGGPVWGGRVPAPGQTATGSGAGGPDSVLQLPNLEPAADSVAGSPSARSATPPSGGGQLTQGGGPGGLASNSSRDGNQAQNTAQGPMSGGSSATASQKGSRGGGQAQGFDWNEAVGSEGVLRRAALPHRMLKPSWGASPDGRSSHHPGTGRFCREPWTRQGDLAREPAR